ncbi:MAG: hypothetical protein KGQ41_03940 [Alphaproteobacteria bacterium]|nr:hypothetical protein [Alphaproteobacteria bacterium]
MQQFGEATQRLRKIFEKSHVVVTAEELIKWGINPYFAHMYAKGITEPALMDELALEKRIDQFWPQSLPRPDAKALLQGILNGREHPSPYVIYDFCQLFDITPDQLLLPSDQVTDGRGHPMPCAPAPVIEAACRFFEDLKQRGAVPEHLRRFLRHEYYKANAWGRRTLLDYDDAEDAFQPNFDFLLEAEENYAALHKDPEHIRKDGVDILYKNASPIDDILHSMDMTIGYYAKFLQDRVTKLGPETEAHARRHRAALKAIHSCVSAICPDGFKDWLLAFERAKHKMGLERALELLSRNPESDVFHPMRIGWMSSASTRLPNGDFVAGPRIIRALCDAYRLYNVHGPAHHRYIAEAETSLTELMDFETWRRAPHTRDFLTAEAIRRHILGHVTPEQLGIKRNKVEYEPVVSSNRMLLSPPRPANHP